MENLGPWCLDPEKLIMMGFLAGGHLALSTVREPGSGGERPRYLVLGYPVVSFRSPLVHSESRDNLLGRDAPDGLVDRFSAEMEWSTTGDGHPFLGPVLLVYSDDDQSVPVGNSLVLAEELSKLGVSVELIRHPVGGHGFGLGPRHGVASAPDWIPRLRSWLSDYSRARRHCSLVYF